MFKMKPYSALTLYCCFMFSILFIVSCSQDDPVGIFAESRNQPEKERNINTTTTTTTTTTLPFSNKKVFNQEPSVRLYNYPLIELLTKTYSWMERSDEVAVLQEFLEVSTDGVYGNRTRQAHIKALQQYGLTTDNVPARQVQRTNTPRPMRENVPPDLLAEIQRLWPQNQWARAVEVAWCESRFIVDAKNPASTASGYFQLLRPWTKDPQDYGQVWGWIYDESGNKLSAAAGLGITETQARWTISNVRVAYEIWWRGGNSWSPWNASRHCWG